MVVRQSAPRPPKEEVEFRPKIALPGPSRPRPGRRVRKELSQKGSAKGKTDPVFHLSDTGLWIEPKLTVWRLRLLLITEPLLLFLISELVIVKLTRLSRMGRRIDRFVQPWFVYDSVNEYHVNVLRTIVLEQSTITQSSILRKEANRRETVIMAQGAFGALIDTCTEFATASTFAEIKVGIESSDI